MIKDMKKIFLIYGHYDENSFNAAIRNTFIKTAEDNGNDTDYDNIVLYFCFINKTKVMK